MTITEAGGFLLRAATGDVLILNRSINWVLEMNIDFYVQRDGEESARETVKLHFRNYLEALTNQKSHASTRDFRSKFVDSLKAMANFLGDEEAKALTTEVRDTVMVRLNKAGQVPGAFVHALNHAVRCAYASIQDTLEVLRAYPLDAEKAPQGTLSASIQVSPEDYQRAIAVLEAAKIAVEVNVA